MPNDDFNTLEDLVFSRSFRNWVLNREGPEADFWTNWVAQNPDRAELVNQAKAVIYALQLQLRPLSEGVIDTEVQKVLQKLRDGRVNLVREIPLRPGLLGRRPSRAWAVAASFAAVAIIAILAGSLHRYLHRDDFYHSFLAANPTKPIRETIADTSTPTRVTLPDGSTARLTRGSHLSWPDGLPANSRKRAVFLEGEAFFDIAHDAAKPFFVYTRSVVTKVLGTSFTVNTAKAGTTVSVTTGKVSVYHRTDLSDGVILTANQQITYDPDKEQGDKRLVADPRPLTATDTAALKFDSTPVPTVFRRLQNKYGITIVYDEEVFSNWSFSATLGNESFYEQLTIVCKTINASYEAIDGTIVVTAKSFK